MIHRQICLGSSAYRQLYTAQRARNIVIPTQRAEKLELAARLKLVAAAGPVAARAVLDCDSRVPIEKGGRLFDRRLKLSLKLDAACSMPLDSDRDRLTFLRMHVEMTGREQNLRLQERKLEQRCREALDKHELGKLRLEFAREREARRAAARACRDEERALVRDGVRAAKKLQMEQRRARWQAERDAAIARAASSPLAALRWGGSENPRSEVPKGESCGNVGGDDHEMIAVIRLAPRLEVSPVPAVVAIPA